MKKSLDYLEANSFLDHKKLRMIPEQLLLVWSICIIGTTGSALHGPCETNDDCGTIDTICHKGVCVCTENFAVWYDSCVSLPLPRITCTKKHECHKSLGIKSMCTKKNQCACKPFHHLHLGQCVKNRDLHDTCDHDHQCYCGGDCQDRIACIHKNCSCKAGHRPYKSRRCISDEPVVLNVGNQQKQVAPIEEAPVEETSVEQVAQVLVPKETSSSSSSTETSTICLIVLMILVILK